MAAGFKPGDKAYIVENNRIVRQCTVVRVSAGMHLIRFENGVIIKKSQINTSVAIFS